MMSERNIVAISLADASEMEDRSRDNAPEGENLGADFWKSARVHYPEGSKEQRKND
jgi:hypothetical protein